MAGADHGLATAERRGNGERDSTRSRSSIGTNTAAEHRRVSATAWAASTPSSGARRCRRRGAPTVPLRGDRRRTRILQSGACRSSRSATRPLAPPSPCHVPTRPGWPGRTTLLLRRYPPWQPGQAETAAAGGADRRSPRTRARRMDQSSTGCSATSRRTGGVGRWSPTSHCRVDRGDPHPLGSAGPSGAGPGQLSVGRQGL
jgi:hypothetical protein